MTRTHAVLLSISVAAGACTAGYRSTEWLALESRLVIVGEVAAAVPLLARHGVGAGEPALLTVRVQRVLKGSIDGDVILVRTGPITSCNMDEEYHAIHVGDSGLFAFVEPPQENTWQLEYAASFRPADDATLFETAMERARSIRAAHVEGWRQRAPEVYEAALRLDERLLALSASWPRARHATHWMVTDPLVAEASLILSVQTVETISLALALDIGEDLVREWSSNEIWEWAGRQVADERPGEFVAFGRARTLEALEAAGIARCDIEAYLTAMEDSDFVGMIEHPFANPGWNPELPIGPLTTGVILRFHSYSRGTLLPVCIMFFGDKSPLDTVRLEPTSRELLNGPDRDHRWAGRWIASGGRERPWWDELPPK